MRFAAVATVEAPREVLRELESRRVATAGGMPRPQLAPAPRGNQRGLKHGAFSALKITPRAEEIAAELREIMPVYEAADEPAVRLLALSLARIERATEWLDEHGMFQSGGHVRPVLRVLPGWETSAARLLGALGLTPAGRSRPARRHDRAGPEDATGDGR